MQNHSNDAHQCHWKISWDAGVKQSLALALSWCLVTVGQAASLDIQTQMSPAEYRAAGLDQLTDAQRAALNAWLERHTNLLAAGQIPSSNSNQAQTPGKPPSEGVQANTGSRAKPAVAPSFGDEQLERQAVALLPEVVIGQIAGEFRGWDGKTLFRLNNGQIWQQRVGGRYRYRAVDPEVKIERARFGYYLEITATGRKVGVKRIK